ncbi:MAG: enoyl-CoA hydratase/isomerase family protein [Myxococcota bacterium]|nr:enoyl-CoA hydratase/isomerase family protein [Myxococcota bacterium]MDW8363766.1 enoyl-CoA hydratase/isomerase family protein [Myxococcales bacterium]
MTETTPLLVETRGAVRLLRLHRPHKRNAFDAELATAFWQAVEAADADDQIRVLVVTGDGPCWTAGVDLELFLRPGGEQAWRLARLYEPLRACRKPTVAAVHGRAVGMGVTLLPHFDLVFAAEDATFQTPFVRLGLVVEYGGSFTLPRLIGRQAAMHMLLTAEPMDARWAERVGLVNAVFPAEGFLERVLGIAEGIAAMPPGAVAECRRLVREGEADPSFTAAVEREEQALAARYGSPETLEAVMQFFASRRR